VTEQPRPRRTTGHRHLVNHFIKGGLIQQDDSGLGWVTASRSGVNFQNRTVARIREKGFSHDRQRYLVIESTHRGKLMAVLDPKQPRRRGPRKKAAQA
jgi:hypothetical protein